MDSYQHSVPSPRILVHNEDPSFDVMDRSSRRAGLTPKALVNTTLGLLLLAVAFMVVNTNSSGAARLESFDTTLLGASAIHKEDYYREYSEANEGSSKGKPPPDGMPKPEEFDWKKIESKGEYNWQKCKESSDPDCWKNEGDRVHNYWKDFGASMKSYWQGFGQAMHNFWAGLFTPQPKPPETILPPPPPPPADDTTPLPPPAKDTTPLPPTEEAPTSVADLPVKKHKTNATVSALSP
jgi:hypothetical protein